MTMAKTLSELKKLSDDEIIELHDTASTHTQVGINYFLEELRGRENAKIAIKVANLTFWIFLLTIIVTLTTLVNLYLFMQSSTL